MACLLSGIPSQGTSNVMSRPPRKRLREYTSIYRLEDGSSDDSDEWDGEEDQEKSDPEYDEGESFGSSVGRRTKEHKCTLCGMVFAKLSKLARHELHHAGKKPYTCTEPGCKSAFVRLDGLKRHQLSHLPPDTGHLSCPECGKRFHEGHHLKRHLRMHKMPKIYVCEQPAVQSNLFHNEEKMQDGERGTGAEVVNKPAPGAGAVEVTQEPVRREIGQNTGTHQESQVVHGAKLGGGLKHSVGNSYESTITTRDQGPGGAGAGALDTHTEPFLVCGARFAKKSQLNAHLQSDHGGACYTPYVCREKGCGGKVFACASKLARHTQRHHKKKFRCEEIGCEETFVRASDRVLHKREKHRGSHRCSVCGARFARKSTLQEHEATHQRAGDGEPVRSFYCGIDGCPKAFTEERNLKAHRRVVHEEGGRSRFPCPWKDCTSTYAYRNSLKAHILKSHEQQQLKGPATNQAKEQKPQGEQTARVGGDEVGGSVLDSKKLEGTISSVLVKDWVKSGSHHPAPPHELTSTQNSNGTQCNPNPATLAEPVSRTAESPSSPIPLPVMRLG
ncbi:unnamed protein product [Choristocarpus tenellus]